MSLEDFSSLQETSYLLSNPRNAERLATAISELENGAGLDKSLQE